MKPGTQSRFRHQAHARYGNAQMLPQKTMGLPIAVSCRIDGPASSQVSESGRFMINHVQGRE